MSNQDSKKISAPEFRVVFSSHKSNSVRQNVYRAAGKSAPKSEADLLRKLADLTLEINVSTCFCTNISVLETLAFSGTSKKNVVSGIRCAFCNVRAFLLDYYRRQKSSNYGSPKSPPKRETIARISRAVITHLNCWRTFCALGRCTKCESTKIIQAYETDYL